jgi:hypothetical protein
VAGGVDGVWVAGGVVGGGVSAGGACATTNPARGLEAGGVGGGAKVTGGATDAGVIRNPGSDGSCSWSGPSLETGGISGGSGVARGVVAGEVGSCGGDCAITKPAAIIDAAVEIAEVPSSRPKRRELDMMDLKHPDLTGLIRRLAAAPMRKPTAVKP